VVKLLALTEKQAEDRLIKQKGKKHYTWRSLRLLLGYASRMVSAYVSEHNIVIGQEKTKEKTNESAKQS